MEKGFPYKSQSRLDLGLTYEPMKTERGNALKLLPEDGNTAAAIDTPVSVPVQRNK